MGMTLFVLGLRIILGTARLIVETARLIFGTAGREIVEINSCLIALIAEGVVDAPVGLGPDWALRTALLGTAAVLRLLLALGGRVGSKVVLPSRRAGRRRWTAKAAFARSTTEGPGCAATAPI